MLQLSLGHTYPGEKTCLQGYFVPKINNNINPDFPYLHIYIPCEKVAKANVEMAKEFHFNNPRRDTIVGSEAGLTGVH